MVDPRRLMALLDRMAEEEQHLHRLAGVDASELLADHDRMHAIKYGFVVAIESAIDAGRHVISSEGLDAPDVLAEVFTVLADAEIVETETARAMEQAARFRNLLVHRYAAVDDRQVVHVLKTSLNDLAAFRRQLADVVSSEEA